MNELIKLGENNLSLIRERIEVPGYARKEIKAGIVHIGAGNFHRSHQAYYTNQVLSKRLDNWGICGVGLMKEDLERYKIFSQQDGLYTLISKESKGSFQAMIIGSIIEYLYGPMNPMAVIQKMSDPCIKIISLTITEGGYNFDSNTGEFIFSDPLIQWDMTHPENPKTVFGFLTQALKSRMLSDISGLTILSCDNIQQNGDVCKKMLLSYITEAEPGIANWVLENCSFPNSMVDRITPISDISDIEYLKTRYQIEDQWPVVAEPFIQWVIEDNFIAGRPKWEEVGAQFVNDVAPYERMKIRLLNAGHTLLGLLGTLLGYKTVDETISDPACKTILRKFMDVEVTPNLGLIEGIDLEEYKDSLIQRFSNPEISDQLTRICSESSTKIPKFVIPTIQDQLKRGGSIQYGALIIACWYRYIELSESSSYNIEIQDIMYKELKQIIISSDKKDPTVFLEIKPVFGDLQHNDIFVKTYHKLILQLRIDDLRNVIRNLNHEGDIHGQKIQM